MQNSGTIAAATSATMRARRLNLALIRLDAARPNHLPILRLKVRHESHRGNQHPAGQSQPALIVKQSRWTR